MTNNYKAFKLRTWLLPMLMNGQVTVNSNLNLNLNLNLNDAGVVDGGLGMVAESGEVYKKGKG